MKKFQLDILLFLLIMILNNTAGTNIIPSEKEMTVAAGADYSMECFGGEPVEWSGYPLSEESKSVKNVFNSKINDGFYKSTIKVQNISFMDTGFYICKAIEDSSEFDEASIYLFVRDVKHLFVFNHSQSVLIHLQHERFHIPCRPTDKDVNVTLWNEHDEQIVTHPYDPYYGFTVLDAQLTDSGIYTCKGHLKDLITDEPQMVFVTVRITLKTYGIKKPKIIFHGDKTGSPVMIGQDVVLECSVTVMLGVQLHFLWTTPINDSENKPMIEIKNSTKNIKVDGIMVKLGKSVLTIKHVTMESQGLYRCTVTDNSDNTNEDKYELHVHSEDTSYLNLTMDGKRIVTVRGEGSTAEWTVKVIAHPIPEITWFNPSGKKLPSDSKKYTIIHGINHSKVVVKDAKIRDSGFYEVEAENLAGKKKLRVYLAVEDVPQAVVTLSDYYLKGEYYFVKCTVLAEPAADVILAFIPCVNETICEESRKKYIDVFHQNSSTIAREYLGKIFAEENGTVTCLATNRYGSFSNDSTFRVTDPKPPVFVEAAMKNNTKYLVVPIGEFIKWKCQATGLPQPMITWYKDGVQLKVNESRLHIRDRNETLVIPIRSEHDDGVYTCIASNKAGTIKTEFILKLKVTVQYGFIILLLAVLVLIICGTALIHMRKKVKKERKLREQITAAGLCYFQDGQIESLNPDLNISEQADLLPYDKKWEVPREKIKLGIQLGSGAFGVVLKGEVSGLRDCESTTTVAVKMAKKNSDVKLLKALISELKIMAHLGQHLNVVNLLGACTAGITRGEVLVLVEYCKYGNLHNYLLKHRDSFKSQVNPHSGNIDTIQSDNSTYIASNSEIYNMGSDYGGVQSVNTEMTTWYAPPSVGQTAQTPQSPVGEDGYLISKNFNGDKIDNELITTKDLICWCYQVARGMEYLASRKVLHGDLAVRNILLSEGNIVKICDFGFAKSMYHDDNYTKKGNDPLPLKWLSIEALRDRVFSTQSDIWAFGIVLWEIFSLAKTPYPGKQFDQQLFDSLLEGYRMEKPDYATEDIYNLMLECWKENPMLRPSFTECADRLGNMLEESLLQHYMELNDPYMKFNALTPGSDDYLNKLNCPTYSNFCTMPTSNDNGSQPDYLNMSKSQQDEMELKPMMQQTGVGSFFNPTYEGLTKVLVCAQINELNENNTQAESNKKEDG